MGEVGAVFVQLVHMPDHSMFFPAALPRKRVGFGRMRRGGSARIVRCAENADGLEAGV